MANYTNAVLTNSNTSNRKTTVRVYETIQRSQKTNHIVTESFPARDLVIFTPTKSINGTVYQAGGTPVSGATVKLVRQTDDLVVQIGVTDAFGRYVFQRDADDVFAYYVLAYTGATSPQVHGVSDRGGVPA